MVGFPRCIRKEMVEITSSVICWGGGWGVRLRVGVREKTWGRDHSSQTGGKTKRKWANSKQNLAEQKPAA